MLYMLLSKIKCLICINHTWIITNKIELSLHRLLYINITCLIINREFLWNNLCTLLYLIKIQQAHSLVCYNSNPSIVPFSVFLAFAFLEPNHFPIYSFKPLLFGVLSLSCSHLLLHVCARCLLRVQDRAADRNHKDQVSKSRRATVAFCWERQVTLTILLPML
jgi:hypothetical protein